MLAAAARVIAARGADGTRFTDVSEASGVPVSTLQYYFGSREDLLVAAFRSASAIELSALRLEIEGLADTWERLTRIVDAALSGYSGGEAASGQLWIESWRFAMRDAEMRTDVLEDYAAWRRLIADAVQAGNADGRWSVTDPERVAVTTIALIDGMGPPLALADPAVSPAFARRAVLDALASALGVHGPVPG